MPIDSLWPVTLEVLKDRLAHDRRKRIHSKVIGFAVAHMQSFALPIDVIQGEASHLAGSQPIDYQQK